MSRLSSTTRQKVSATTKSNAAELVSLNERIEQLELINKELTGLVFRLANNIYQLQTQIDDVKKNIEGSFDTDTTQVVGEAQ